MRTRVPEHERSAEVLGNAFQIYGNTGRFDQAHAVAERALQIDPMWPHRRSFWQQVDGVSFRIFPKGHY